MVELRVEALAAYVKAAFGASAELKGVGEIGSLDEQGMKGFGYGKPLRIVYTVEGREREAVVSTMRGDEYGHQFYWDRAAILLFQYETGGRMERHVLPLGAGYVNHAGEMIPLDRPKEFFVVNEKVEGHDYFLDLDRIRKSGLADGDVELARDLALWLAGVHALKKDDRHLYERRIRDLIGSSECIMGLVDNAYPHPYPSFPEERFIALEKRLVEWRWKLKAFAHRLCAVHGDFHPWNVLVREKNEFSVLDRSRGEWGDAADDVSTMALNYLLFGLSDGLSVAAPFKRLYSTFMDTYLEATADEEMLAVMGPYFVFRGLVIASPQWYPDHAQTVRDGLLRFLENVLSEERFEAQNVERYFAG